ncbi:hypothetical protein PF005_g30959 [Phytophthora fragariae]|uniref:Uncharacterized protein n=1 Tax=Phytophthora fragariae TaxID=53985 RepID=A0A6A3Q8M7_9STRA|nr:hypothetical protein PF003_g40937 [Phytophthora fragariae]KAE8874911.1 hypothetical protein PF003_g40929 [Phytophthora fragariae]KAE8874925.1 hypothetical protein PF003_g40955 [Phytophthora fragariae]KAE8874939.1 hypothetical protein PF003_g40942 [Phytophthora fragariae]KAE8922452.1 hypothetical protein PF009_g27289 [Phytophthora fragariae]
MQFVDWEGHIGCGQHCGLVPLRAANALDEYDGVVTVELPDTRFTPNGTTNILSQDLLEKQGWMPSYPPSEDVDGRKHWLTRGDARLEFVKTAGHYWLRDEHVLTAVVKEDPE